MQSSASGGMALTAYVLTAFLENQVYFFIFNNLIMYLLFIIQLFIYIYRDQFQAINM